MGLSGRKKSKARLLDTLLKNLPPDKREEIIAHFSGMGNHEIVALFCGPHWKPRVEKLYQCANSKPKQIKIYVNNFNDGGCAFYIRGKFTKDDAQFLIHELLNCSRTGDSMLAEPKWIDRLMEKQLSVRKSSGI